MHIGWILGSCLLCAGGFVLSTVGIGIAQVDQQILVFALWGLGACVSGFVAARASKGSTILEPAIGAVLFIAVMAGTFIATPLGEVFMTLVKAFPEARNEMLLVAAEIGGAFVVGGVAGAWAGEKTQERAGEIGGGLRVVLAFLMILGGVFFAVFIAVMVTLGESEPVNMVLIGLALGSFLGGAAAGRGGAGGLATAAGACMSGALLLVFVIMINGDHDAIFGAILLSVGMLICASIGGLLGRIGTKQAEAEA